jgi:dolichyl-phosphate-mannose-protein mannosyltransferase
MEDAPLLADRPAEIGISKTFDQDYPSKIVGVQNEKQDSLFGYLKAADITGLVYLTVVALVVRLAFISHPSVVVFDEVHFGGFAQKYLRGEFFNDLHPPLARLLVTLSAWIGGFDGRFSFYDIGADYTRYNVPYVTMRAASALAGVAVVPIAFATMRAAGLRRATAGAFAAMLACENALTTQSRLILLDAYLVLFTAAVGLFWVLLQKQQRVNPFGKAWLSAMIGLGISLGLAASCKWVGLFAVAAVGLHTVADLWRMLGDRTIKLSTLAKHVAHRVYALILLPLAIYAGIFWMHLSLLRDASPAASSFSVGFQQTLRGGALPPTMKHVHYGAAVRLRQMRPDGPFLHSHIHTYPTGSKQQQVTGYHHRDGNNLWYIRRIRFTGEQERAAATAKAAGNEYEPLPEETDLESHELIRLYHGDLIRLEHIPTGKFLHSHPVAPPVSNKEKQHEVSAYGIAHGPTTFSDSNDNWRIEMVDSNGDSITAEQDEFGEKPYTKPGGERIPIDAQTSRFRLVHSNLGCKLHCRGKSLPEWGYKQNEVTCGTETLRSNQIWIFESNVHPLQAEDAAVETVSFPVPSFIERFIEMNVRMWRTNAGLPSEHPFASRPDSWPLLSRGLGFWNGNHKPKTEAQHLESKRLKDLPQGAPAVPEEEVISPEEADERAQLSKTYEGFRGQQIYLLGNPLLWWAAAAGIAAYVGLVVVYRISQRLGLRVSSLIDSSALGGQLNFGSTSGFLFVQWLWHYVPFFGMKRQLFLHHYLPALYFSVILLAVLTDAGLASAAALLGLSEGGARRMRGFVLSVASASVIAVFYQFSPLAYGLRMTQSQCLSLRWLPRWDFDCGSLRDEGASMLVTP